MHTGWALSESSNVGAAHYPSGPDSPDGSQLCVSHRSYETIHQLVVVVDGYETSRDKALTEKAIESNNNA